MYMCTYMNIRYVVHNKNINKTSEDRCFDIFDFVAFYTSIPHDMLKNSIRTMICEAYKVQRG